MSYQHSKKNYRRQCRPSLKRQQGVVIVVALFIVAIVATMAYAMMARLDRDTRRTTMILRDTQAEFYAQGSIAWAMDQLRSNLLNKKPNQVADKIPIASGENVLNGYKISSTIYDMQGRFNLNNLSDERSLNNFRRLIQLVSPELTIDKIDALLLAAKDWLLPTTLQNQYSKYYLDLKMPYRAGHRSFVNVSELRLVKGVTPELYAALRPYLTVLPMPTDVNVQTAEAPAIAMLSPVMPLAAANEVIKTRIQKPFVTKEAFAGSDIVKNHQLFQEQPFAIDSSYFLVETKVSIENQHVVLYTLLERTGSNGKASLTVLGQSKGVW